MDPTAVSAGDAGSSDRKATLLNLLKFSSSGHSPSQSVQESASQPARTATPETHSRTASALAAARGSLFTQSTNSQSAGANPQEQLLRLLNRGVSQPSDVPIASTTVDLAAAVPSQEQEKIIKANNVTEASGGEIKEVDETEPASQPVSSTIFNFTSPFEQLSVERATSKFGSEAPNSNSPGHASPAATTNGRKILTPKSPAPRLPDGRTQVEALLGIGARRSESTSVPQALNEVAEETSKQAVAAVERAEHETSTEHRDSTKQATMKEFKQTMKQVAKEMKQEFNSADGPTELEQSLPAPLAKALRETVEELAKDGPADSWESADSAGKDDDSVPVRVYDFPMRPFVSLVLEGSKCQSTPIRAESYSKVASFKKEFDQQDRVLTSATPTHIIYALAKGGGYRVIQQEEGANKQVFRKGDNPIYNISIASLKGEGFEPILAASTNGSVYYSETPLGGEGALQQDLDKLGFIFPPLASQEDISSTTQLKTRAKLSSNSHRYFAIARGKSIHFVWPKVARLPAYLDSSTRVVNSEKYLKERCQKIGTGKASKDFTFSIDDTVLASIDKTGRLKFWDIREHTNFVYDNTFEPHKVEPVEAKTPLMMLQASSERAGASPTSILFLDKDKTYGRKIAQRYMLVGLKQNHTLQLWDLHLGKAVQELNFPHEKDDDPFCSVAFHPQSSMIVVGHPTRNSIFYAHLSAPKYLLKGMSQVDYVIRCAQGGTDLPRLESTAIMTGVREISLNDLGQLRSLDVMSIREDEDTDTVFELYIMHSRGVSYATVKPEDLGWNKDRKIEDSLDAQAEGVITILDLPALPESTGPENGADASVEQPKKQAPSPTKQIEQVSAAPASDVSANGKTDKKKKKKPSEQPIKEVAKETVQPPVPASYANAARSVEATEIASKGAGQEMQETASGTAPTADDASILSEIPKPVLPSSIPRTIDFAPGPAADDQARSLSSALTQQFESLYKRLDDDKRVWEASSAAKQDAILRLVASTLTENVEKSLARIVNTAVEKSLAPALSDPSSLEQKISNSITQKIDSTLSRELGKVASRVENELTKRIQDKVVPAIKEDAVASVQKTTHALEHLMKGHLREYDLARQADHTKIDRLVATVETLNNSHAELEQKITRLESLLSNQGNVAASAPPATREVEAPLPPKPKTEVEILLEMMAQNKYEDVFIRWLQSPKHAELFDMVFHTINPEHLKDVNPLVSLSVIPDISASFATHLEERLNWLDSVLTVIDTNDNDTALHAGNIMDILISRMQALYFQIMENDPSHRFLARVHSVMRAARELSKGVPHA